MFVNFLICGVDFTMRRNRGLSILAILIVVIMAPIILHYFVEWKQEMQLFVWPVEEGDPGGLERIDGTLESALKERGKY